jgi:hypothetical protein
MKQAAIPAARAKLAAALPSTTEILRGSLLHRLIGVNYFFGSTTTISPYQRQLPSDA